MYLSYLNHRQPEASNRYTSMINRQICWIFCIILAAFNTGFIFNMKEVRFSINYRNAIATNIIPECLEYNELFRLEMPQDVIKSKRIYSLDNIEFIKPDVTFVTYFILNNVMIGNNYQILYNGTYMQSFGALEFEIFSPHPMKSFDEAICINHYHTYFFGTLVHDIFPAFLMIPRNLIETLPIIVFQWHDYTKEFMHLLGLTTKNVVNIYDPQYVYVKKLHTIHNIEFCLIGPPMINVLNIFKEKYNLNSYPATKYVVINRPKGKKRHISNFHEFLMLVKSKFDNINWEVIDGHITGLKNAAIYWTQMKLVFSPVGSGLTGSQLFMKENSVCVCVMLDWPDSFIYAQARTFKLILVLWQQSEYKHFETKEIDINITKAMKSMELGVSLSNDPKVTKSLMMIEENKFMLL